MPDVPHLAWPFRMAGHQLAQVEQDSLDDVQQNVYAYLATSRGERPLSPDFGVDDPTFGTVDARLLAAEIEDAEDRASVTVTISPNDQGRVEVDVSVELAE